MTTGIFAWVAASAVTVTVWVSPTAAQTAAPSAAAQSAKASANDKVTINGWAVNTSNTATGPNQTIRININSWSSPAQRQELISTFLEKKQDGLLKELGKQPAHWRCHFPGYL